MSLLVDEIDGVAIVERFCENILYLLHNRIEKNKISESAFDYAKNQFGIDKFNQSYRNIFS